MKKSIVILSLFALFGCHKNDPPTPITPTPKIDYSKDTGSVFLKASNWVQQYQWVNLYGSGKTLIGFYAADTIPSLFNSTDGQQDDSLLLYVFNNGWQRVRPYDNSLSVFLGYGNEYITTYPLDTLVYMGAGSDGALAGSPNGKIYLQLMYETYSFTTQNHINTPADININLRIFVKPINSNISL